METIKGREYFRIPEWVQIAVFAFAVSLASVALWTVVTPKEKLVRYAANKPSIYIINHAEYYNLDGKTVYCLDYTVDGVGQVANFPTEKEMMEFQQYLSKIGDVAE